MRMNKKYWWIVLVLVLVCACPLSVSAKEKNITKTFKDKKKVNRLLGYFDAVAASDSSNKTTVHDFSKNKERKKALYEIGGIYASSDNDISFIKNLSKVLFGKSTTRLKSYEWYDGWGYGESEIRNIKYYQCSGNNYRVRYTTYMVYDGQNGTVRDKVADCTFDIQKKKGTKYGYIVKKMRAVRTSW